MKTLGKYEVLEELGAGAMGKVFHGRDRVLQREVAIKTISTEDADVELKQRFYREARSCGRLSHPNIVTVFDLGEQQGTSYIAMEYLEGDDLRRFIDKKTFMPLEGKLQVMAEVCEGLAHAHDSRVIHRDIKPSNIFLLKSGRPKLLDFGIAKVFASQLTRVGNALGTPEYMAPEQIRGKEADTRSDIFSTAMVFFELLTHEHPFGDSDIPRKIIQENPKSLRALNPLIPEKLEQILNRALAKDPAERLQTATEFAKALRKLSFEVMASCDRMITEALQNRQIILDALAVISNTGDLPWIQKKLQDSGVDAGLVGKINPEMAKMTNANLHYFSLCALSKDLARAAAVFAEVSGEHQRISQDIERARELFKDGKTGDALQVLDTLKSRRSDYPQINELQRDIESALERKREAEKQEAEQQAKKTQAGIKTPAAPATVVMPSAKAEGEKEKLSPELLAVRKRIETLFHDDVDKCLAEIEILSPGLANDSVIDSYWVRALSMRSSQQAASAAAKDQAAASAAPPTPDAETRPAGASALPDTRLEVPTRFSAPQENSITGEAVLESKPGLIGKLRDPRIIGAAAGGLIVIVLLVYGLSGGSKAPVTSPQPAPLAQSSDRPPAKPAVPEPEQKVIPPVVSNAPPVQDKPSRPPQQQRPAAVVDWSKDLASARALFSEEKYDAAIALCDKILRAQPSNKDAADLRKRALGAKALEEQLRGQ